MSSGTSTMATFAFVMLEQAFAFINTTFALGTDRFLFAQQPVYAVAYGGSRGCQYISIAIATFFG